MAILIGHVMGFAHSCWSFFCRFVCLSHALLSLLVAVLVSRVVHALSTFWIAFSSFSFAWLLMSVGLHNKTLEAYHSRVLTFCDTYVNVHLIIYQHICYLFTNCVWHLCIEAFLSDGGRKRDVWVLHFSLWPGECLMLLAHWLCDYVWNRSVDYWSGKQAVNSHVCGKIRFKFEVRSYNYSGAICGLQCKDIIKSIWHHAAVYRDRHNGVKTLSFLIYYIYVVEMMMAMTVIKLMVMCWLLRWWLCLDECSWTVARHFISQQHSSWCSRDSGSNWGRQVLMLPLWLLLLSQNGCTAKTEVNW